MTITPNPNQVKETLDRLHAPQYVTIPLQRSARQPAEDLPIVDRRKPKGERTTTKAVGGLKRRLMEQKQQIRAKGRTRSLTRGRIPTSLDLPTVELPRQREACLTRSLLQQFGTFDRTLPGS